MKEDHLKIASQLAEAQLEERWGKFLLEVDTEHGRFVEQTQGALRLSSGVHSSKIQKLHEEEVKRTAQIILDSFAEVLQPAGQPVSRSALKERFQELFEQTVSKLQSNLGKSLETKATRTRKWADAKIFELHSRLESAQKASQAPGSRKGPQEASTAHQTDWKRRATHNQQQAAEILGVNRKTVRKYIKDDILKTTMNNRITTEELQRFLNLED